MTQLTNRQKELLWDYCVGVISEDEAVEAEQLISSSTEAAEFALKLRTVFSPLEYAKSHTCPDELVEITVSRLTNLARASQLQLQQLLDAERSKTIPVTNFWRNFAQVAAVAAAIVFISAGLIAPLSYARQMAWKQACQLQLHRIWQGLTNYSNDHDGQMPEVASVAGQPWWKVGYQGQENYSNTRNIWLLAKGGYVNATDFICPAKSQGKMIQFDPAKAKSYNDFPARRYVTYSFRIKSRNPGSNGMGGKKILIADLNPVFERLPRNYSQALAVQLNEMLMNINSSNHKRCGQNVLFGDGSVSFTKTRKVGIADDDIFTLQNTSIYQGTEVPASEGDIFVAP